jgi:predicted ATPase/DNA-binding SARP family transcriptional activator
VVDDHGCVLALGGFKQRAVLAILLLHANEVVPSERLIDELWAQRPPGSATKTVQVYVSKLRRALGHELLVTHGHGYMLRVEPGEMDADRFQSLVGDGRDKLSAGDPRSAGALLREALELWRGPPLADFAGESFATGEIARLEEMRLAALEDRVDADLALGEHAPLVGELEALARQHPLRERLSGQLILALYRAGRQADALAAYRKLSALLREELGLEPSGPLQTLELSILRRDASLDLRPVATSRTFTFLLADLDVGTRSREHHREARDEAFARYEAILGDAVASLSGQLVSSTGTRAMAVFASPLDGVSASVKAQQRFRDEPLGQIGSLWVRMALHVGEAVMRQGHYYGPTLQRAERLVSAGHGGQILLSAAAAARVADELMGESTLRDLGEHQLKDSGRAEQVSQLVHPGLQVDFPPLFTPARQASELPEPTSGFVGRDAELRQIAQLLEDEPVRLLTLTGPGGVGKTRLALEAARAQIDRFDRLVFVDLSAVRDHREVLISIAEAIGLTDTDAGLLRDELVRRTRRQRVLLLLDNFEQVIAAAPAVADLFADCARLKLLVTSREALRVSAEQLLPVQPLSLPNLSRHAYAEQLADSEAVQLFVKRATAVAPKFRLTDQNAGAVAQICLRLDGLPLAIELAAARINLLSPEALRSRLGSGLQLLRHGARDAPARQQTLRATLEWSYQLLQPAEQRMFELLSAFSGAGIDAIEEVSSSSNPYDETEIEIVDGVVSLLDKNLIRMAEPEDGEPRVEMLETMREYAAERLDKQPEFAANTRRAHAAYYAAFARRQWEKLAGDGREAALAALTANSENLRLAWRYWIGEADLSQLDALVDSVWRLYDSRGWYDATIELTNELLTVMASTPRTAERAMREVTLRTSLARALLARHGYTDEVEQAYTRALALFDEEQEPPELLPILRGLASFYNLRAEFAKGAHVGREILRLAEARADKSMRVDGHLVLGSSLAMHHDLRGGLDHLDKAIACFESQHQPARRFGLGNNPGVAALTTSALTLWMLGYPDRALVRADRAVALATDLEHPFTLAYALFHTGFLHLWRREAELARDRAVSALDIADEYDLPIWRALGSCLLGAAKTGLSGSEEGLTDIREGTSMYQRLKTPPAFWALVLLLYAGACGRSGRPDEGLSLLAEASGVLDEAMKRGGEGAGTTLLPEFYLLRGNLLVLLDEARAGGADPWLLRAFESAHKLQARLPQLRAALALSRAQAKRGDPARGTELLRTTYATFTEGFSTADLIDARHILEPGTAAEPADGRRALVERYVHFDTSRSSTRL